MPPKPLRHLSAGGVVLAVFLVLLTIWVTQWLLELGRFLYHALLW